jgi:hypothetical protein
MTATRSDNREPIWDGGDRLGPADRPRSVLLSLVVGSTARPRCTIYPPDVAVPLRSTRWITATGDSFANLAECR